MKREIGFCEFCDCFRDMDRQDQFSYEGKRALYDYLERYSENIGEEYSLDVIALCCDFCEYENIEEFKKEHRGEYETIEDIENETLVLRCYDYKDTELDNFIIQNF